MKKELKNKLIFISGVVFALALLFVSVQMIQAGWTAPTAPFPGGTVYPPIDIGPGFQTKEGGVIFGSSTSAIFGGIVKIQPGQSFAVDSAEGGSFYPSQGSVGAVLNSQKGFYINTSGLVLPRIPNGSLVAPYGDVEGMIYYDTTNKSVKLFNGKWVDIGSGGGGDSFWKPTAGGIAYSGSGVTINSSNSGWWYEGTETIVMKDGNSISLINIAQAKLPRNTPPMSCDLNETKLECKENYYSGTGDETEGSYASDRFEEYSYSCPSESYDLEGQQCCYDNGSTKSCIDATKNTTVKDKIYKFYTKQNALPGQLTVVGDIKANTANIGVVNTTDINLSNPQWSKTVEVEHNGGTESMGNSYITGFQDCPPGMFVSGFRFGRNGTTLNFVLRCSKL